MDQNLKIRENSDELITELLIFKSKVQNAKDNGRKECYILIPLLETAVKIIKIFGFEIENISSEENGSFFRIRW